MPTENIPEVANSLPDTFGVCNHDATTSTAATATGSATPSPSPSPTPTPTPTINVVLVSLGDHRRRRHAVDPTVGRDLSH